MKPKGRAYSYITTCLTVPTLKMMINAYLSRCGVTNVENWKSGFC